MAAPTAPPAVPGTAAFEAGSFRDRTGRVFYRDGRVLRALSAAALEEWDAVSGAAFFPRAMAAGNIVPTVRASPAETAEAGVGSEWAAVLRHEAIPFISYPYEWSFGMLRDAALLHLELMSAALSENVILKDASAFNVQWRGTRPTFIDVPSFVRLPAGEPWLGYRQFCRMFLYPLLLQSYRNVDFQPWLRGRLDGIEPRELMNLLGPRDYLRRGVLSHVVLHARLERHAGDSANAVKQALGARGFDKKLIERNVKLLTRLVEGLEWRPAASAWSDYAQQAPSAQQDGDAKERFVREFVASRPWRLTWDLGCNTGRFARIAAEHAEYVVAVDRDHLCVERLYRALRDEQVRNVLPLVHDLSDPSPGLGWRGRERRTLCQRSRPDLTLCLALLHHLVIGANILLPEIIDWLAGLGTHLVIEFVGKADPMVQSLLRNKADQYAEYTPEVFERCLSQSFDVLRRAPLASGNRTLYYAVPKS